ncbi:MAG: hypothetical protein IIY52_08040 [Solobacterium sp.]|nr:hypothetical protein [Erysipelotrichaceae bacterium]MBQ1325943.1 hypothetical protein [Solobacterium sp.]MBQ1446761.1 hypothetical protein [Solobacterium sp.]MBR2727216.1 hypothetical protein [Solobacterium sp.]
MTKQLRRVLSWIIIGFDALMILFFVSDAVSNYPIDFRLDAFAAFIFALNAIMTKDYINYLSKDIKAEEQEERDIPRYENKVNYRPQPKEEEIDTEELIRMLQQKKEEYTHKTQ